MTEDNNTRLFIGARVSVATLRELTDAVRAMRKVATERDLLVNWVTPATYHVTIKYLGWTRPETIGAIKDRLDGALAGVRALSFTTEGVGAFPKTEEARVLWAGVNDMHGGLAKLAALVESAVVDLGFPKEKRAFHPHVTLGRAKKLVDAGELLHSATEQKFSTTRVDTLVLYESVLKSKGSEYIVRGQWGLDRGSEADSRR